MSKKSAPLLIFILLILGILTYLSVHTIANSYLASSKSIASNCDRHGVAHHVIIMLGQATPHQTIATLCDTLTITNKDDQIRLIAFGEHDNHQAYDGVVEHALEKNQTLTITLKKAGTYRFHDHLDDSAQGTFTVE